VVALGLRIVSVKADLFLKQDKQIKHALIEGEFQLCLLFSFTSTLILHQHTHPLMEWTIKGKEWRAIISTEGSEFYSRSLCLITGRKNWCAAWADRFHIKSRPCACDVCCVAPLLCSELSLCSALLFFIRHPAVTSQTKRFALAARISISHMKYAKSACIIEF
jgi:hypothetical protein